MSKKILLVCSGVFHPNLWAQRVLKKTLTELPGFSFVQVKNMDKLPAIDLREFAGMVLYYHDKTISPDALQAFVSYVENGGGVLAVHGASASFKKEEKYFEVLGGRFVEHGKVENFELLPNSDADDIFGQGVRFTVYDEIYRHEYDADNTIHYYVEIEGGENTKNILLKEPIVWTRVYGNGRVCYCALGHTASALKQPQSQTILRRGLQWISGSRLDV